MTKKPPKNIFLASEMHAKSKKMVPTYFLSCLFSKIQKRAKYVVFFVENFISARNGEVFLRKFIKQTRMKMGKKIDFFGGPT
jgi:hypothetical protein